MKFPLFFFTKKPIVLDCFTAEAHAFEFAPPQKGTKFFPDWWKALPLPDEEFAFEATKTHINMRHCVGFVDMFRKAVALPLWSDIAVQVHFDPNVGFRYEYADGRSTASAHPSDQHKGFMPPHAGQHVKLESPWRFKTSESVEWVATPSTFNVNSLDYTLLPGVVNFKYWHGTHAQFVFARKPQEVATYNLRHGMPLYMYIPMSERPVDIRRHLVSAEELNQIKNVHFKFSKSGMATRKLRQTCPISTKE